MLCFFLGEYLFIHECWLIVDVYNVPTNNVNVNEVDNRLCRTLNDLVPFIKKRKKTKNENYMLGKTPCSV